MFHSKNHSKYLMMNVPFMIARGCVSYVSELRMYVSFIN